ncbi:hypothetical protein FA95DRAFT_1563615 [Auriscalpium vulgare]|uniref:Uncharacterized protein n=1 Tax=Auriscalpium vulgare TaxID=40419 RepID=A0ACB8RFZ2_9AGAM|nr:hypothetical protein FA95DRAFT_1563615 [Auriscalpium vulgare]
MFKLFVSAPAVVLPRLFAFPPRIAMCNLYPRACQPRTLSSSTDPTEREGRRFYRAVDLRVSLSSLPVVIPWHCIHILRGFVAPT